MNPIFTPSLHSQRHQFVVDFVRKNKPTKVVTKIQTRIKQEFSYFFVLAWKLTFARSEAAERQYLVYPVLPVDEAFSINLLSSCLFFFFHQVADLGCGECRLLKQLRFQRSIELLVGVDVNGAKIKKNM